ncbi:MAG: hypothetical protein KDI52_11990 [Xanthomonadales bacterium]|nr:hypothetical protein [Xanthomonadales bacterium]
MNYKSRTWHYPLENETQIIVSFDGMLVKWVRDIIENPNNHFKAEDDRRWGVYNDWHQTLAKFLEKPKLDVLPDEMYQEICTHIRNNFDELDFEESNRQYLALNPSYWVPVNEVIYTDISDGVKKEYYLMNDSILVMIWDYSDVYDKDVRKEKILFSEILDNPEEYPGKVVEIVQNL